MARYPYAHSGAGALAANVYLSELKDIGSKIYFYEKGFMHQKTMLVEAVLAMLTNYANLKIHTVPAQVKN